MNIKEPWILFVLLAGSLFPTIAGAEPATRASSTAGVPCVVRENDTIRIEAGVLERVIRVSGGNVATERLAVSGLPLLGGRAAELTFRISRATPNRNPLAWVDDRSFSADSWGRCFELVNVTVAAPKPGTQRLLIRVWIFRIGVVSEGGGRRHRRRPGLAHNPWVGAQVASPQSPILRPGRCSW